MGALPGRATSCWMRGVRPRRPDHPRIGNQHRRLSSRPDVQGAAALRAPCRTRFLELGRPKAAREIFKSAAEPAPEIRVYPAENAGRVNRTWLYREQVGFSGFPP